MEKILCVKNLEKSFGKNKVLKEISFDVQNFSVTGFLGPNGAGKTTTIKLILGFLNPDNGLIEIFGDSKKHYENIKKIGYVPEAPQFYPFLKGRELLELTGKLLKIDPKNLNNKIESLTRNFFLNDFLEKKIYSYSFGTLKKLAFVQSLLGDPELLIIDEPYNGLDPIAINVVREMIIEFRKKGKAIFVSSHLLSEMERICDDVILINNGNVIISGNLRKIKEGMILSSKKTLPTLEDIFFTLLEVEKIVDL